MDRILLKPESARFKTTDLCPFKYGLKEDPCKEVPD